MLHYETYFMLRYFLFNNLKNVSYFPTPCKNNVYKVIIKRKIIIILSNWFNYQIILIILMQLEFLNRHLFLLIKKLNSFINEINFH